jgi:hypothetical protein
MLDMAIDVPKPVSLSKMINLAEILAKDFNFVRVDLYQLNDGTIKFGEMTFTPGSGIGKFCPEKYDILLGKKFEVN